MEDKLGTGAVLTPGEKRKLLEPPYVSVIVPVYNKEEHVGRCLDSLVLQTLEEIEIIIVNDGSTDRSQTVIDEYVSRYAPKLTAFAKENGGLSSARKYGLEHVRSPYVCFVDSDDYVSHQLCELALNKILENDADLVYFPSEYVSTEAKTCEVRGVLPDNASQEDLISLGLASFCGFIWKTSFLREHDPFLNMWYEDAATTPALISHARRIGIITIPLYSYVRDIEGSITNNKMDHRTLDFLKADHIVWERCSLKYKQALAIRLARRLFGELRNSPYYDRVVEHAKSLRGVLLPYLEEKPEQIPPHIWKALRDAWEMPEPWLPLKIYLDGFSVADEHRQAYYERVQYAFWNGAETVWLDEATCDLSEAPDSVQLAYRQGDMDFVAGYFAVKNIYLHGGVFLAPCIRMTDTLNCLRFDQAFFGFLCKDEFTDRIFGGRSGHPAFRQLLETYDLEGTLKRHAERIGSVLVEFGGIHLEGGESLSIEGLHTYPVGMFVLPVIGMRNVCRHDFSDAPASPSVLCIPKKINDEISRLHVEQYNAERQAHEKTKHALANTKDSYEKLKDAHEKLKYAYEKQKESNLALKAQMKEWEEKVNSFEHSLSWKITKPLRWFMRKKNR